ncbi:hypothetical protein [Paenibacillus terrae]|uniref:Uncharacterized protein n=1 Tax=Paenibacillus terrae TaxID=159743 RepID=A0A0D7X3I7_9BACL|nr:hypothetical protein [Paenibacillus terrae]KJD45784.1 hypothetical protein QD47_09845 [Paenibacillus terrae]
MLTVMKERTWLLKTRESVFIVFLTAMILCGIISPNTASAATSVYTISAFTNSSESNLYIYQSYNATNYGLLKGSA